MAPSIHALAAVVLLAATGWATAETAPPPPAVSGGDNFTIAPAEGRHLKIDRRTGRVSLCSEKDGAWNCRLVADDRDAYEDEIARLEKENADLKREVDELKAELAARDGNEHWVTPEDEKKLDEFLTFSDKAIRRFFDMVQDLKRDLDQPDSL